MSSLLQELQPVPNPPINPMLFPVHPLSASWCIPNLCLKKKKISLIKMINYDKASWITSYCIYLVERLFKKKRKNIFTGVQFRAPWRQNWRRLSPCLRHSCRSGYTQSSGRPAPGRPGWSNFVIEERLIENWFIIITTRPGWSDFVIEVKLIENLLQI